MQELPLFPLNTVLFPKAPLRLHIFEQRYKEMIRMCISEEHEFGVVLVRSMKAKPDPLDEVYLTGCSARIVDVEYLSDGRMNILAVGQERFQILSINKEKKAYLVGLVEAYPLQITDAGKTYYQAELVRKQMESFISILVKAREGDFDYEQLPEDPIQLAYTAAAILQINPSQKQELLKIEYANDFLSALKPIYQLEKTFLNMMVEHGKYEIEEIFSRN